MASRNLLSGMHRIGRDFNNRAFGGTNRDRCSHNDRIYLSNLSGQCTILQKAYGLTWAGLLVPAACHGLVVVPTTTTTPSRASSSPCTTTTTLTLSHPLPRPQTCLPGSRHGTCSTGRGQEVPSGHASFAILAWSGEAGDILTGCWTLLIFPPPPPPASKHTTHCPFSTYPGPHTTHPPIHRTKGWRFQASKCWCGLCRRVPF